MTSADFLRVVSGPSRGRQVPLVDRVVIGRSGDGLRIDDPATSRTHAVVAVNGSVTVADAGSSRGTTLNGTAITSPVEFPLAATLRVGKSEVRRLRLVRHARGAGVDITVTGPDGASHEHVVRDRATVGRDAGSDIPIDDAGVSRTHLTLERSGTQLIVTDAGSRGGVIVNGRRIQTPTTARSGDEIELGSTGWVIRISGAAATAASREFRVRAEADDELHALQLDADPAGTVESVAAVVAGLLGVTIEQRCTFYRDADGVVLHPDDLWSAVGLERGEVLVLADVEVGEASASDPRQPRGHVVRPGGRIVEPPQLVVLEAPRAPESAALKGRGIGWQLAGGAVGVIGGLVIAIALNNWLFAVIGGVTGIGAVVFSVLGDQSRRRHRVREFDAKVADAQLKATRAIEEQRQLLLRLCPGPQEWNDLIATGSVWERRTGDADFLRLRLGVGERRAAIRVDLPRDDPDPQFATTLAKLAEERLLSEVAVQSASGGVLGVVGPNRAVDGLLRSLVMDAAVHHAPSSLSIHLLADGDEWDYALWLPHVADTTGSRLGAGRDSNGFQRRLTRDIDEGRRVLVVMRAESASVGAQVVRDWRPEWGVLVIAASGASALPKQAQAWVVVEDGAAHVEGAYPDAPVGSFAPDRLDHDSAERLALAAAVLVDPHATAPRGAGARSLIELSGARTGGTLDLGRNWLRGHPRLNAVLGIADDGTPLDVVLRHTVIAGTTGSGKSELLATLLASLIARQSPEELSLFLIDFKGGATFNRFASAPHTVGVVTDLESDERLARRAFLSLDVELRRRKQLLAAAHATDIDRYRELAVGEKLSTLLVVVDEFALLAQTVPEVKVQLDTIAAQGRSVGIFLVLATQSPTGVVTPAIKNNTDIWLSLRVVSDQESRDVLGAVDAARLPIDAPGRAILRRGAEDRLTVFQTARVTVVAAATGSAVVSVRPFGAASASLVSTASQPSTGPEDLDLLISEARDEARRSRLPAPRTLWLPPLPTRISMEGLPDLEPGGALPVRLGLADLVSEQRQPTYSADIGTTGLLITGAPRSGRSTALLQVAADLAETHPPARVHLYALHANGALDAVARLPHSGGVVQLDDQERLVRLLDRLTMTIEERRSRGRQHGEPDIVLLVDDYTAVREALEHRAHGRQHDQLVSIAVSGRPAGVFIATAASQPTDLRMAALAGLGNRLMLRAVDRSDYQSIEWRPTLDELPPPTPGRAVVAGGHEVQVVLADLDRAAEVAASWPLEGAPRQIVAMPSVVSLEEIAVAAPDELDPIGLGGRELGPVGIETAPGAHLAVLGEGGTGRSTALLTIGSAHLRRAGNRVVAFAPRGGPLTRLDGQPGARVHPDERLDDFVAELSAAQPGTLILIDDADRWPGSAADVLERHLRQGGDRGIRIVVGARAADWTRSFDGWVRYVSSLKSALLLSSFTELAPTLDVRLEPPPAPPAPGRGYLVVRGRVDHLQVAMP